MEREIVFANADQPPLALEGMLSLPATASGTRVPAAILCHPQPLTSDMHDPLLVAVAERLARAGIATLRFNFRGAGHSEGQFTEGRREPLDLAGAMTRLLDEATVEPGRVCMVGHAFGGVVALVYAAHDARVGMVVAISPPAARLVDGVGAFNRPRLVITGEFDEIAPPHRLQPWVESLPGGCALSVVAQGRHLLEGHIDVAVEATVRFVERWAFAPVR